MRNIDTSAYSSQMPSRIKPEEIDLGNLPAIEKPKSTPSQTATPLDSSKPKEKLLAETERNSERKSERTEFRTEKRSVLPIKRQTKRYSFEFFVDQLSRLKKLQNKVEATGESVSLSDMAREAFDAYLQEKGELP